MASTPFIGLLPEGTVAREAELRSGLRMRWYERGKAPGRACVVLLHGFPELALSWRFQLAGLAEAYRVVAPDMRGYGGTEAPRRVRDYALGSLCADVVDLCDELGEERIHLVGHDWGGAVAWEVAHRFASRLRSLAVLNCPPTSMVARSLWRPGQLRRSWYIFFFQLPWLPEWWTGRDPDKMIRAAFRGTAANKEPFSEESLVPYVRQIRERGLPAINYYRAAMRQLTLRHRRVEVPTRLIWGIEDPFLGPWFAEPRRYRSFVPKLDRVLIPGAAHWVQQESPTEVNAALSEHWESVDGRSAAA